MSDEALIYSDAHIEYWAQVYHANQLARRRIRFDLFVQYPCEVLGAVLAGRKPPLPEGMELYPLLPAQQAVADRLACEERVEALCQGAPEGYDLDHLFSRGGDVIEMHGKRWIERMRRRCLGKSWKNRNGHPVTSARRAG